jgi:hypothetical protein
MSTSVGLSAGLLGGRSDVGWRIVVGSGHGECFDLLFSRSMVELCCSR